VQALFEADADAADLSERLRQTLEHTLPGLQIQHIEDRQWEREWLKDFHAMRFGQRLWVCPRHETVTEPDAAVVLLDPGLAFGTGTHATTAMCLEWLDARPPVNAEVIDYGCGSGILAIAALKLGARQAHCFDIDPQALTATRDNATDNGVIDRTVICESAGQLPTGGVDVLLANILSGPLVRLAPDFAALVRPGGQLVLSGLMTSQQEEVTAACLPWFDEVRPFACRDGWVALEARRRQDFCPPQMRTNTAVVATPENQTAPALSTLAPNAASTPDSAPESDPTPTPDAAPGSDSTSAESSPLPESQPATNPGNEIDLVALPAPGSDPAPTESSPLPEPQPATDPAAEVDLVALGLAPAPRVSNWPPKIACGALILLLALQAAHHWRDDLAAIPALHGPVTALYAQLGLPLAPRWDVSRYEVRQLGVSTDAPPDVPNNTPPPNTGANTQTAPKTSTQISNQANNQTSAPANALANTQGSVKTDAPAASHIELHASIKNTAAYAQPLPLLRVMLEDRFSNLIGARDLEPREYLARLPVGGMLAPDGRVDATVDVVDPDPQVTGFELDACLRLRTQTIVCAHDP
jgi:ribosomal protein L11 methyltransferase